MNTFSFTETLGVTFSLGILDRAGQGHEKMGKNEPIHSPN
jgi:hypothetical protein